MRTILAALLAAFVVMIWGAVSWVVLPWHLMTMSTIPDGEAVVSVLSERLAEPGIYHYPGVPEEGGDARVEEAWAERYRRGPNIHFLAYSVEGFEPSNPWIYVRGFLLNVVAAFLAAALLARAAPALPRFGHRVLFVALLGGFAAVQARLLDWNWWAFPLDYSLVMAVDLVVAWTLAGLVLAWRIGPATPVVGGTS
jgi:hypothetical protein